MLTKVLRPPTLEFRTDGHRWGRFHNLVETPLFVDSRATRLIQAADLVAYAMRKFYAGGDPQFLDLIKERFDAVGGVVHGLNSYTLTRPASATVAPIA